MSTKPIRFGLIVTGQAEAQAIHEPLNRAFAKYASCVFEVHWRNDQLRPRKEQFVQLRIVGTDKPANRRDEELGLRALAYLRVDPDRRYLLVVDDLEGDDPGPVFNRYRNALDSVLKKTGLADRASVHFLVNMLEAYFFAHSAAINHVAGQTVLAADDATDVELIGNPKSRLKQLWAHYSETDHGAPICRGLDFDHILARPDQCCWLRAMMAWCADRLVAHQSFYTDLDPAIFCLAEGCRTDMTYKQTSTG